MTVQELIWTLAENHKPDDTVTVAVELPPTTPGKTRWAYGVATDVWIDDEDDACIGHLGMADSLTIDGQP